MTVVLRLFCSHASYLLPHKVHQLIAYLHSKDKFIRKNGRQGEEQTSVPAPNIDDRHSFSFQTVLSRLFVEGGVFDGVAVCFEVVLGAASEVQRVVGLPIDVGVVRGVGKRRGI